MSSLHGAVLACLHNVQHQCRTTAHLVLGARVRRSRRLRPASHEAATTKDGIHRRRDFALRQHNARGATRTAAPGKSNIISQ